MKVNMAQPRPKKQKTITTTKHFVKPLRNEETKSNKKNCKLLGKKPKQWPQNTSAPLHLVLWSIPGQVTDVTQVAWSGCYLVATSKEGKISLDFYNYYNHLIHQIIGYEN